MSLVVVDGQPGFQQRIIQFDELFTWSLGVSVLLGSPLDDGDLCEDGTIGLVNGLPSLLIPGKQVSSWDTWL